MTASHSDLSPEVVTEQKPERTPWPASEPQTAGRPGLASLASPAPSGEALGKPGLGRERSRRDLSCRGRSPQYGRARKTEKPICRQSSSP
jgi:hypothetical protein